MFDIDLVEWVRLIYQVELLLTTTTAEAALFLSVLSTPLALFIFILALDYSRAHNDHELSAGSCANQRKNNANAYTHSGKRR